MTKSLILFTTIIVSVFSAKAQTADTAKTNVLDEVIVTANKFPQKQSTTGKVITVITKEQIERSSGRTVSQLLNEQAGITISGALNNTGTNQTVFMRGASAGRTLILLDGIPLNDPSLITNDFDLNLFSLNNIERVEISRGGQSTLYGSDAIAGVVNIITANNNIPKPISVKAMVSAGNYGTFRGNAQAFGNTGKLTYSTRYARLTTKGFSSAFDSTGNKNYERDSYNGDVASGTLQYQITPDLSFRTFLQYSRYKTDLDASLFTDEKDFIVKNRSVIAGGGFNYRKNNVRLTGSYQYSDNTRNYYNDSLDRPSFTRFSTDDYFGISRFVELYSSIALNKNFTLLQGADYRFNSMNSAFTSISSFGPFNSRFKDTSLSQSSLYSSLFYHTTDEKLNIELGGRLNVHSRYGSNSTFTFNPSYTINPHLRLFGSIATGFKAPTLYHLYSTAGRRDLKPEESTTYEIGIQQNHSKMQTRLVYFHRDIKNGIDFDYIGFKYFNFNRQTVDGIEFETTVQPINNFTISANYTYLKPEEKSQSRVTFKDTTYSILLRRPAHNLNTTAAYTHNGLYISATAKYVSSRYDVGGYQRADILMDGYFLLGAYTEFRMKEYMKFFADAQNITNKKFFDVRGYNSIPFLFTAGVALSW